MNQKEIKELIELLVEKDIAEFELERGDMKLHIKRGGAASPAPVVHVTPAVAPISTIPVSAAPPAISSPEAPAEAKPAAGAGSGCRTAYREIAHRRNILRISFARRTALFQDR